MTARSQAAAVLSDEHILGRRFNVMKRSAWFPRDFLVRSAIGVSLSIQNEHETYLVSRDRFEAEYGSTFVEVGA